MGELGRVSQWRTDWMRQNTHDFVRDTVRSELLDIKRQLRELEALLTVIKERLEGGHG